MRFGFWGLVLLAFTAGLFAHPLIEQTKQFPSSPYAAEKASPQDRIPESSIKVYNDKVVLDIKDAKWASFADTNSMDPLLDKGANAIQIKPQSCEDIKTGDIITYNYNGRKIIHRVMQRSYDEKGAYFIVKGDNNDEPDPLKVRCGDVERVLIAIIY